MSRLSDVISRVIEDRTIAGTLTVHDATKDVMARASEEDIKALASEAIGNRIKSAMCRITKAASESAGEVTSLLFPDLRPAHALDADERLIKQTRELSLLEFRRIIEIREKQIAADTAYLSILRRAYERLKPYWKADMTFAEAENSCRASAAALTPPEPQSEAVA